MFHPDNEHNYKEKKGGEGSGDTGNQKKCCVCEPTMLM